MSKEINPRTKSSWTTLRRQLTTLDKQELVTLVKDLYEASAANRDFIQARCQAGEHSGVFERYRARIVEQFYPARGEPKLKLAEARKAIRDYRKASGDLAGTAELLVTYVEQGAEFTVDYGDIDQRFYNSILSALDELTSLLVREAREEYPKLSERLARVERITQRVGWGFHDHIVEVVWLLEDEFSDE